MENNLRYSIIYGVINTETREQISLGLVVIDNEGIAVRYSSKKLRVLRMLYSDNEYRFISRVVKSMRFDSESDIDYMSRYSNNLLSLSAVQPIELPPTKKNKDWLYRNYVYSGA